MSEVEKKEEVVEKKEEVVEKKEETPATTEEKAEGEEKAADSEPEVDFGERIKLQQKTIATNEEGEEVVYKERAKLFRFDTTEGPQWKERGLGEIRFLKDKTTEKVRLVMRREVVLKVCLNHYLDPNLVLEPMPGSDKSWTWKCPLDFADDDHPEGVPEIFAIRFGSVEGANKFKDQFNDFKNKNKELANKN